MKLYGGDLSFFVSKVRMLMNYLDMDYTYERVSIPKGETRTPEYLRMHPGGKIPALDDDGFYLFESNAMLRYLAQKVNSPLYPTALKQRAQVEQWIDFVSMHVGNGISRVLFNKVIAPKFGMPVDENSLKDGMAFLERFLPVVENQLAKSSYLAGDALTLADFVLLATVDPLEIIGVDVAAYPKLQAWRESLRAQPFYQKVHAAYGVALR